jgi:hypothetical protein
MVHKNRVCLRPLLQNLLNGQLEVEGVSVHYAPKIPDCEKSLFALAQITCEFLYKSANQLGFGARGGLKSFQKLHNEKKTCRGACDMLLELRREGLWIAPL